MAYKHVSEGTATKDYGDGPSKYASSGTRELWVFDPLRFGPPSNGGPWLIQVWERTKGGRFRRTYAGDGPVYSEAIGAWLRVSDDGLTLRASDDEEGTRVWPTEAEYAEQQRRDAVKYKKRARAEKERAAKERERADQERERAAKERADKEAALARIAELEALLRGGT